MDCIKVFSCVPSARADFDWIEIFGESLSHEQALALARAVRAAVKGADTQRTKVVAYVAWPYKAPIKFRKGSLSGLVYAAVCSAGGIYAKQLRLDLGISRDAVSRSLTRLRRRGMVHCESRLWYADR
jgi:DNA-binding transcriptional ArsR family regulator